MSNKNECVIKRRLMFKNYIVCLFNDRIILQSQQRFKSDHQDVYTEQIPENALVVMMIRHYKHLIKLQRIHTYYKSLKMIAAMCILNRSKRLH